METLTIHSINLLDSFGNFEDTAILFRINGFPIVAMGAANNEFHLDCIKIEDELEYNVLASIPTPNAEDLIDRLFTEAEYEDLRWRTNKTLAKFILKEAA
jgi:hypothetical protein